MSIAIFNSYAKKFKSILQVVRSNPTIFTKTIGNTYTNKVLVEMSEAEDEEAAQLFFDSLNETESRIGRKINVKKKKDIKVCTCVLLKNIEPKSAKISAERKLDEIIADFIGENEEEDFFNA